MNAIPYTRDVTVFMVLTELCVNIATPPATSDSGLTRFSEIAHRVEVGSAAAARPFLEG